MANLKTESNESQMHLEAMLYLLDDPALDRDAFEARLANDTQLAEILAETVSVFQSLQKVEFESEKQSMARTAHASVYSYHRWQSIPVIAASLLIIGFLGWQTIQSMRSHSNAIALNNVVWAWGELQTDNSDSQLNRDVGESDFENTFAMLEPTSDSDVPEWLVLATVANVEGIADLQDGKAIIQ